MPSVPCLRAESDTGAKTVMAVLVGSRSGCLSGMLRSYSCTAPLIPVVPVGQMEQVGQGVPKNDQHNPVGVLEQEDMAVDKGPREDRGLVHTLELETAAANPKDKPRHIVVHQTVGSGH